MARGPSAFCACLGLEQTSHVSASLGFPVQAEPFITYLELLHCLVASDLEMYFPVENRLGHVSATSSCSLLGFLLSQQAFSRAAVMLWAPWGHRPSRCHPGMGPGNGSVNVSWMD